MPDAKLLLFIRHGHSVANAMPLDELAKTGMAMSDFPLTDRGREQAAFTQRFVTERYGRIERIVCSDFMRALQTALIVFPKRKMLIDPRLGEVNYGVWPRLTSERITEQTHDEMVRNSMMRPYLYRPTGGESWQDTEVRVREIIGEIPNWAERTIALVGHGQWFNLFERLVENLSVEEIERRFYAQQYVANASVTAYTVTGDGRIVVSGKTEVPWHGHVSV